MSFHGMFLGETGSGKTYKARQLAATFRKQGVGVLAFVPPGHHWTEASWQTSDAVAFSSMVSRARGCAVFIEISDAEVSKYDGDFVRMFTWGRNLGHRCFAIAQRHTQINATIRDQCRWLWLFRVGFKTADILAEEYVDRSLCGAPNLKDYHFFLKKRGIPATTHTP